MLSAVKSALFSGRASTVSVATEMASRALSTTPALEWHKRSWRGNGYGFHGGPWLCLFDPNNGERESFPLAHQRFKRLDWGMYIRPRAGRAKKHWKKTGSEMWKLEQHIFCAPFHVRRLERMFAPEVKEPRHIPNDPYLKYNRLSYWKHSDTNRKNKENIRRLGVETYRFNRWKAHLSKHYTKYNKLPRDDYRPPGYLEDVAANGGVYRGEEFIPADEPAPHFQRPPIRVNRGMIDKEHRVMMDLMMHGGRLEPWHPLLKSKFRKF